MTKIPTLIEHPKEALAGCLGELRFRIMYMIQSVKDESMSPRAEYSSLMTRDVKMSPAVGK
jgi:hypothetical protein